MPLRVLIADEDPGPRSSCSRLSLSDAEIATTLIVSEATVKTPINHVFAKIGARERAQAVRYACTHGLAG
jgi:DNA-binding NarL/FixJ family response regulator